MTEIADPTIAPMANATIVHRLYDAFADFDGSSAARHRIDLASVWLVGGAPGNPHDKERLARLVDDLLNDTVPPSVDAATEASRLAVAILRAEAPLRSTPGGAFIDRVVDEAIDGSANLGESESMVDRMRARVLTADELENLPPPEWLIDGFIARNSLFVMFGKPGGGKTFALLDWAASVATGSWWFGHPVQQGPVLYVIAEGADGMSLRSRAWKKARNTYKTAGLYFYPEAVNLLHVDEVIALTKIVTELQPALIIFDTLGRSMAGGDENGPRDMGVIVNHLDAIRRSSRAAVGVAHHGTKADGSLRGHTALEGAADTVVEVKGSDSRVRLTVMKQKDAAAAPPLSLYLVPVDLDESDGRNSCVLAERSAGDDVSGVTDQARLVLEVLAGAALDDGLSASSWLKLCVEQGVAESSFYKHRKTLDSSGLLHTIGTEHRPRYKPATSTDDEPGDEF